MSLLNILSRIIISIWIVGLIFWLWEWIKDKDWYVQMDNKIKTMITLHEEYKKNPSAYQGKFYKMVTDLNLHSDLNATHYYKVLTTQPERVTMCTLYTYDHGFSASKRTDFDHIPSNFVEISSTEFEIAAIECAAYLKDHLSS